VENEGKSENVGGLAKIQEILGGFLWFFEKVCGIWCTKYRLASVR